MGRTACRARPEGRFPIFTQVFQGAGKYSNTFAKSLTRQVTTEGINVLFLSHLTSIGTSIIPPSS